MPIEINSVWILHIWPLKQNSILPFLKLSCFLFFLMFGFVNNNAHSKLDGRKDGLQFCETHAMEWTLLANIVYKLLLANIVYLFGIYQSSQISYNEGVPVQKEQVLTRISVSLPCSSYVSYSTRLLNAFFWYIKQQYTNVDPEIPIWSCQSSSNSITGFNPSWLQTIMLGRTSCPEDRLKQFSENMAVLVR